jgi:enediyne biosynthesis protein E4
MRRPLAAARRPAALAWTLGAVIALPHAAAEPPWFEEAPAAIGLDFAHVNGMSGAMYIAEMMGAGAALFDYDNDGDLDVYLRQGGTLGEGQRPGDRLYRNDLGVRTDGARSLRFTDVTRTARLPPTGYGMGVAAGDYDGDGWADLYLTNLGQNVMLRNRGDGSFEDATARTGTADARWSVPATFFDYDRDGWLDLLVGNYVDFTVPGHRPCRRPSGALDYCGPRSYRPEPLRLFHNRGDGSFDDATARAGLAALRGNAMGAVAADLDGDGWLDAYVANDALENFLLVNRRDGRFEERGVESGSALNEAGERQGSMGVDAADYDGDGDFDLFVTNLVGEGHVLYRNDGRGLFTDVTHAAGLAAATRPFTGFGAAWIDYDGDGWLDLLTVNGAVTVVEALERARDPFPLGQSRQLFRNRGDGTFEEKSDAEASAFRRLEVGRGAAFGDVDNDGDTDVLVANNNGPARLLLNRGRPGARWLGLRLVGGAGQRDQLGARVELRRDGARPIARHVRADGSYASASDPRVLVALSGADVPRGVRVLWPDGRAEEFAVPALNAYTLLRKGTGTPVPEGP